MGTVSPTRLTTPRDFPRSSLPLLPTDQSQLVRTLLSHSTLLPHTVLLMLPQFLPMLSMPQSTTLSMLPQSTTLSTQLPTLSMLPQLLPTLSMHQSTMLSMLPQLLPTQLPMLLLLMTLLSNLPTHSPTLLLMTTPSPASTLRNHLMELPMLLDPPLLLFLMAESNTSSTPPTDMMDSSLMSPMRELLSTQRRWLPQPQLTTLK